MMATTSGTASSSTNTRQRKKQLQQQSNHQKKQTAKNTTNGNQISGNNEKKNQKNNSQTTKCRYIIPVVFIISVFLLLLLLLSGITLTITTDDDHDENRHHNQSIQNRLQEEVNANNNGNSYNTLQEQKLITTMGSYELIETIRHDTKAFTQGLVLVENHYSDSKTQLPYYMVESTGMNGESQVRILDYSNNGNVVSKYSLSKEYFGEGITSYNYYDSDDTNQIVERRFIQITWQDQIAFIYKIITRQEQEQTQGRQQLEEDTTTTVTMLQEESNTAPLLIVPLSNFTYRTTTNEAWGITYRDDLHIFYVSDGSEYIHRWNATTFQEIHPKIRITMQQQQHNGRTKTVPIQYVNELEWDPVSQTILANIWYQDYIIRIEPDTGHVRIIYDLSTLYKKRIAKADCLNGIALSSISNEQEQEDGKQEIWVTGKYWPKMFHIRLLD